MARSDFGATITIPVIVGATGTINIFHDQIHNHMWKPIQVQVELTQLEMCATITIFVHSTPESNLVILANRYHIPICLIQSSCPLNILLPSA
jgi:hypothetical protein